MASGDSTGRAALIGIGAGLVALVLVVGTVFGVQALGTEPDADARQEPGPAPSVFEIPTEPAPADEVSTADLSPLDDGIADSEYPPRASVVVRGYPEAYRMEDWVWDRVGPNWSVVAYSGELGYGDEVLASLPPAVVYLMSPEGKFFELLVVRDSRRDSLGIVTWREDQREAVVKVGFDHEQHFVVDLETGKFESLTFSRDGATSNGGRLLVASPEGVELWAASYWSTLDEGDSFYRWDPVGGMQPVLTGVSDIHAPFYTSGATPDRDAFLFLVHDVGDSTFTSSRSGPIGQPRFVRYELDSGESKLLAPQYPASRLPCLPDYYNFGFGESGDFIWVCEGGGVAIDPVTGSASPVPKSALWNSHDSTEYPGLTLRKIPDDPKYEWRDFGYSALTYSAGGESLTITFEIDDGGYGAEIWSVSELEPGLVEVKTYGGDYLIDTEGMTYARWWPVVEYSGRRWVYPDGKSYGTGSGQEIWGCGC